MTNGLKILSSNFFNRKISVRTIAIVLLFVCVFAVFMNVGLSIFLGPIMAVLMVYLYTSGYSAIITALIIVANAALGTIFLGKLSFQYLLLILAALGLTQKRSFNRSEIVFFVVSLILQLELVLDGFIDFRMFLFSMIYIFAILALPKNDDTMISFLRGIIITVGLIALHACITGGVEFTEYADDVIIKRKGILGTGIGDPNYSCFLLNVGLVCTWCDKKIEKRWKIILSGVMIVAMMNTVSISGLLALIIITVLFFLSGEKKTKGTMLLLIFILAVVLLVGMYISAPKELHVAGVDNYISRVMEKLTALERGDMDTVTTDRSVLFSDYLAYIFSQPLIGLLFGGNSLNIIRGFVPHNTYIGFLLQIGLVGAFAVLMWMVSRAQKAIALPANDVMKRRILLLKALSAFFALNLSFYQGSLWAIWMLVLILL